MIDTSVNYLGLELKSPFIAASSGYTADLEKIVALARSGAGAIVLKSLFEEQISNEIGFLESVGADSPESLDFLKRYVTDYSVGNYVKLIKDAKKESGIPVIASINCFSLSSWTDFAKEIEKAGADALELNIYSLPMNRESNSTEIESGYWNIVNQVTKELKIPVAVKISDNFTNIGNFVNGLQGHGAKGAVLFNRFFTPDISLKSMKITPAKPFSSKTEYLKELRWTAILSSQLRQFDLSASTGVYDPSSGIKLLLAGAKTVQLCSVLYKQGPFVVADFNNELKEFMKSKGFNKVSDFCGMLNYGNIADPASFERVQFLKTAEQYSKDKK
ncbi:MAG: dihydroorotate dehydrogenase-like protein [Bacteroidales bacterium]|nr:dihydroorotate dehydrogenase-like protein [Bacteroidales bacterium]